MWIIQSKFIAYLKNQKKPSKYNDEDKQIISDYYRTGKLNLIEEDNENNFGFTGLEGIQNTISTHFPQFIDEYHETEDKYPIKVKIHYVDLQSSEA